MKFIKVLSIVVGSFGVCFVVAQLAAFTGLVQSTQSQPKGPVDLVLDGHHDQAIAQAKTLLAELKKKNWDRTKVDSKLLRLPDQDYSSDSIQRRSGTPSFAVGSVVIDIYREKVAFYSPLYTDVERTRGSGGAEGIVSSRPRGFFIVGWKNGRVEKVPVQDVRIFPYPLGQRTVGVFVFPGMKEYDSTLPAFGSPNSIR